MASSTSTPNDILAPETELRLATQVSVRFSSAESDPVLEYEGGTMTISPSSLVLLEIFSQPRSVEDAFAMLKERCRGIQQWVELTSELLTWSRAGVLVSEKQAFEFGRVPELYDAPSVHTRMLNDRARTGGFVRALHEVVRPGDVVLDLGTGTGVFAVAAAQAGARRVYAVEVLGIIELATKVFQDNGWAHVIEPIRGRSTELEFPERANVMVSEMIDSEPLGGGILEYTLDARRRLLTPDARLIPSMLEVWALPILVPDSELQYHSFTAENAANWQSWYGIDFSALYEAWKNRPAIMMVDPLTARKWPRVTDPIQLMNINLATFEETSMEGQGTAVCSSSGRVNGILTFFRAEFSPGNWVSTSPFEASQTNCRANPLRLLSHPLNFAAGERLRVEYRFRKSAQTMHDMRLERC